MTTVVWHGWSGYGVGAGFEYNESGVSDRGYSSEERDASMEEISPDFKELRGVSKNDGKDM